MRDAEHRRNSFIMGAIVGAFRCMQEGRGNDPAMVFGSMLASGAGAALTEGLPDVIDPPTGPSHRDVAHGALPVGALTVAAFNAAQNTPDPIMRRFAEGMAIGPATHLAADATTPKGINLIKRGF